ncbi:hypothetical protein K505DRAFT_318191 [Melanomma pulvis-pyrius CBS 109.77]|uniref:Uncharacterized protein n=1 Tax=Melanomma pulvis-pyrius CBS 109.77 TaxID=1314802 RepID=A0A6A6WR81_9PLEO|nr:hypothetical protein K505DRAFT_318191 [Melanomma pulvis-pyrius CBS 109.77]
MSDSPNVEAARPTLQAASSASQGATDVFPLLDLPIELRDKIYDHVLAIPDSRGDSALRIERRHLKYFQPTAASILLLLHHEYFLLSRQIAHEALEVLLKKHTVFLSCGPFVLKTLLSRIEAEESGIGTQWLRWMRKIELEWVTFPNLRIYPPNRDDGKDDWWWEQEEGEDYMEVNVDNIRGAQYNGHYDEHDHEGGHYDDNFYDPSDMSLYPSFDQDQNEPGSGGSGLAASSANDPFGFSTHRPFMDTLDDLPYDTTAQEEIATKLKLLVSMEVTPLFAYLSSPLFALSSITLPLYFISKQTYLHRNTTRPGYALPLKIRFWIQVVVHALLMLRPAQSTLREVRIKYMPWDIWASMDPSDDLPRMVERGVWFRDGDGDSDGEDDGDGDGGAAVQEGEGEAFKAVWHELARRDVELYTRWLDAKVRFVKWEGDLDKWRVGDELEVVFTRAVAAGAGSGSL